MHQSKRRLLLLTIITLIFAGIACSLCSCAINTNATTVNTIKKTEYNNYVCDTAYGGLEDCTDVINGVLCDFEEDDETYITLKGYSRFLDSKLSNSVVTRYEWLKQLMDTLSVDVSSSTKDFERVLDKDYFDGSEYFATAVKNGIIGSRSNSFDPNCAVTRQYVSTTLINAVGYPRNSKLSCADYKTIEDKAQAAAAVYLGYLELDENNCFNPYGTVTTEQVEFIISELEVLNTLEGKTVMSFGDSIMHGDGNNYVGIADLMAQRYMMTAVDYSKGGSTFGYVSDREQISNQILTAIQNHEKADVIIINGGTNDMRKVSAGEVSDDFEYGKHGREDFCSGMEYALGLLKDNYPDTPILYVRAHNMEYGIERNELHFGALALDICEKWEVEVADIFSESGLNGHDEYMKSAYTVHTKKCENGDSIHPNRLGYLKFYLPIIGEKTAQLLSK